VKQMTVMVVAGDPSGDASAAELVKSLAGAIPVAQSGIPQDQQPLTARPRQAFSAPADRIWRGRAWNWPST
jgi:hypothetical protein